MLGIELVPDLTHCIEAVAKREHADILRQLLAPGQATSELQEKLETLRLFLETANFKKLRAESEKRLMEGEKVIFRVYLANGALEYEMKVT